MRVLRLLVAGVVASVSVLAVGSAEAHAAAAPYTVFTLDNGASSDVFDQTNATIGVLASTSAQVTAHMTSGSSTYTATITAPTGQNLTVGTFPSSATADATHAGFTMAQNAVPPCGSPTGSITIREVASDPGTQALTALAVSYNNPGCFSAGGEIRWQSSVPYTGIGLSTTNLLVGAPVRDTSAPQPITITSLGAGPLGLGTATLTGTDVDMFSITSDTCSHATLLYGQTCVVDVVVHPLAETVYDANLTITDNTVLGQRTVVIQGYGSANVQGTYVAVTQQRLLDTRDGTGTGHAGALGPNGTLHLQITGRGGQVGVPSTNVAAVVLNVTVTAPTAASFLTVYPTGVARPTASNLNFTPGWTGANLVTVPVGAGGQVDLYNHIGSVQVIADVLGYYVTDNTEISGGYLFPGTPTRLLDTRVPSFGGAVPAWSTVMLPMSFSGINNRDVQAVAVNVTAVDPAASGNLTVWNGMGAVPLASTLNFTPHTIVPNLAVVRTGECNVSLSCVGEPAIYITNRSPGSVHLVVDYFAMYTVGPNPGGLWYKPVTPTRITDTRIGLGAPHALGPAQTEAVTTPATIAGPDTIALATNVTAVLPTTATYLTVWPTGLGQPTVSNLNLTGGQIVPNAVITGIGPTNQFNVFNHAGTVNVIVDVAGTFEDSSPPALRMQGWATPRFTVTPGSASLIPG